MFLKKSFSIQIHLYHPLISQQSQTSWENKHENYT